MTVIYVKRGAFVAVCTATTTLPVVYTWNVA